MTRATIKNILANLVAFLLFYNVLSLVVFFFYGDISPILWWLAVPFFLMQVIRAKASNAYAFTILHIALMAIVWFVSNNWFAVGFVAVAVVYSFNIKGGGEWEPTRNTGIITLATHVVMFVVAGRWPGGYAWLFQQQLAGACIAALGFIIIYIHMDNIDLSLRMLQSPDDDRHASGRVLRLNNALIIVFAGLVVVVSLFVAALPLGRALAAGWGVISASVSGLFARFGREAPRFDFPEQEVVRRYGVIESGRFVFASPDSVMFAEEVDFGFSEEFERHLAYGTTPLDHYLVRILAVVGMAIIVFNFIKYFVNLSRRRSQARHRNDQKTSLTRDILGDIRDLLPRFGRYSNNAIRREYTKKVNHHIRHGIRVRKSDTTDIIAAKIRNTENIDELTAMYEKVRYYK